MNPLKIGLVDDSIHFRHALSFFLKIELKVQIIAEASNAKEFWMNSDFYSADIILMDIIMPEIDGVTLTKQILQLKDFKIIAITLHYDKVYLISLIEAGFKGCIFKNNLFTELKLAIDKVSKGQYYFPENIMMDINKQNLIK